MCLSIIKDIVIIGAAIVGAYVALAGLNTWRKQLRGKSEYELAKKVLRQIYEYRQALESVRFGFFSPEEMERAREESSEESGDREARTREQLTIYTHRIEKVNDVRVGLEGTLIEVEVLLSKDLPAKVRQLYRFEDELSGAIREHLDAIRTGTRPDDRERIHRTIISRSNREEDDFYQRFQSEIEDIEKDISPYLKRFGS